MKWEVPSRSLIKAWRATQVCAADDEARPVLHRSACIEVFDGHGMRLVATDSYILVRAWVGFDSLDHNMEPGLDELPDKTFVVSDEDHRALGLMKYIEKVYRKEGDPEVWPLLTLSRQREIVDDQGVFEGMEAETLRIEWPDHEEVVLRLVEGDFPTWRHIEVARETESTELIAFTSRTLAAMAKLGELYGGYSIDWMLSGDLNAVSFSVGPLHGLLMPARSTTVPPQPESND